MTASAPSQFSAAPSAAGYLYQCRYALLLLLKRSREDPDAQVGIEKFDDISFEKSGTPTELIQTKHHLGSDPPSLSDGSTDLWKTLRVWSESVKSGAVSPTATSFLIVTCASAPPSSAASLLRVAAGRDPSRAHDLLVAAAGRMTNKELLPARDAFLALPDATRLEILRSVIVVDQAQNVVDVRGQIRAEVVRAVRDQHLEAFLERLEGWWFDQLIQRLAGVTSRPITAIELERFMDDLRDTFRADSLPIDFLRAMPADGEVAADGRTFVRQLRLITLPEGIIRWARIDYYRAYSQRSRWLIDNLVVLPQLDEYDDALVEDLERQRDRLAARSELASDPVKLGQSLYDHCYEHCRHVRPNCTEPYVGRGSYHMLADRRRVGWHPEYARLLADGTESAKGGTL